MFAPNLKRARGHDRALTPFLLFAVIAFSRIQNALFRTIFLCGRAPKRKPRHRLLRCYFIPYFHYIIIIITSVQRTLTVGGRITVRLVSSLTRLELTNEGNIILFVFSEAVFLMQPFKTGDQPYSDPSPNCECSLLRLVHSSVLLPPSPHLMVSYRGSLAS